MRVERKRMGDMLLAEGAVTAEQIDEALEASKREGIKLGESLVRLGYVTEDTIAQALSNQLKIERVHLAEEFVDDSFVKMIPGDVLRRYVMIPLCYEKDNVNRVRVAMSDPMDMRAMDEFQIITGLQLDPVIATRYEIETALDRYYADAETETVRIANQGQITTYPYKMEDTVTVGATHAQNYRLDLENTTGAGLHFQVEGDYSDWKDVPKQTTGHNPLQKVNKGSLVYATDEKKAYGHVEIRDNNKDNPSSYRSFGISIRNTDGHGTGVWTDPFTVDGKGNITKSVQMDGHEIGKTYTTEDTVTIRAMIMPLFDLY